MSPETNGNPPPVARRKKNRDKMLTNTPKINDFNPPLYNNFVNSMSSFPNSVNSDSYQPFLNYSIPTESMSLPVYPTNYPNYMPVTQPVGFGSMQNGPMSYYMRMNHAESNDYMSLPVGTLDQNDNPDKRRFSDPGLPNESDSNSSNSIDGKIINKLTQQINGLKESNRLLQRELAEVRMEVGMLKQQQIATRNTDREYEPGMLADVIREVRDAARVREDALLARVKHMIEERQFSMSQLHLATEKHRNSDRLAKLEEQVKNMSITHNRSEDNVSLSSSLVTEEAPNSARQVLELEREALQLRRELQEARARKEESDHKLLQLDKKLCTLLRRKDSTSGETSEDGKISENSFTVSTASTATLSTPQRITLSGPVTDL